MIRRLTKTHLTALKLATTVAVIALLASRLDWSRAHTALTSMNVGWLVTAFAVFFGMTLLETARLRIVFGYLGLGVWDAYKLQSIGFFWSAFLPGQIAGDLYRMMVVRSVGGTLSQTVAALLALRAVAFSVVLSGAVLGAVLVWPEMHLWASSFDAAERPAFNPPLTAAVVFALLAAATAGAWLAYGFSRSSQRVKRAVELLRMAFSQLPPQRLLALFLISVCVHTLRVLLMNALVRSLGGDVALDLLLFVTSAAVFASHLPIAFGGLGTREAAIIVLLLPLGIAYEEGTLIAVAGRCVSMLFALWGGILFLIVRRTARPPEEGEPERTGSA